MNKVAYIACSYQNRVQYQPLVESIKTLLLARDYKVHVPVFDLSTIELHDYQTIMNESFKLLQGSTLLVAEASEKNVGVGIEVGYAKALKIPTIYLQQEHAEISTTIKGTVSSHITYSSSDDATRQLSELVS